MFKLGFRKKRRLLTSKECAWMEARAFQVPEQHKQTEAWGLCTELLVVKQGRNGWSVLSGRVDDQVR